MILINPEPVASVASRLIPDVHQRYEGVPRHRRNFELTLHARGGFPVCETRPITAVVIVVHLGNKYTI